MLILDPTTGQYIEIVVPPRPSETKPELKARILAEKVARQEAASRARRQRELDEGAL